MGAFLKRGAARAVLAFGARLDLHRRGSPHPPPKAWIDAGAERARRKARRSCSVYLLFLPAVAAHDGLALLNWALNAHTAALKLPDG